MNVATDKWKIGTLFKYEGIASVIEVRYESASKTGFYNQMRIHV